MKTLNKRITQYLARDWVKDNALAAITGILIIGTLVIFALNSDTTATVETATVVFSVSAPDKYSAADGYLLARLEDGKAIQLSLPQGWIQPAPGKHIRVKRITRLFFGERFVLLKD